MSILVLELRYETLALPGDPDQRLVLPGRHRLRDRATPRAAGELDRGRPGRAGLRACNRRGGGGVFEGVSLGGRSDDEAFRRFATGAMGPLGRLAYLLCGDRHFADDLVQSCLIKLYQAWPRIRQPDEVDAYVRRVLIRCWLNERRRPWRRVESRDGVVPDRPADRSDPALGIGSAHARDVLRHALAELPPRQRAAVVLRYWSQLSVAETATALRCSEGTVKSQTARGLANLRTAMIRRGVDGAVATEVSS